MVKLCLTASISPVESLPNIFGGTNANDRELGLPHETPCGQNYSIHRSPKGYNLDRLADTYLEASILAHYHPGTQVYKRKCTSAIMLEHVMVSPPRGCFVGEIRDLNHFHDCSRHVGKSFDRGKQMLLYTCFH